MWGKSKKKKKKTRVENISKKPLLALKVVTIFLYDLLSNIN